MLHTTFPFLPPLPPPPPPPLRCMTYLCQNTMKKWELQPDFLFRICIDSKMRREYCYSDVLLTSSFILNLLHWYGYRFKHPNNDNREIYFSFLNNYYMVLSGCYTLRLLTLRHICCSFSQLKQPNQRCGLEQIPMKMIKSRSLSTRSDLYFVFQ